MLHVFLWTPAVILFVLPYAQPVIALSENPEIVLNAQQFLGIPVALLGAVMMSVGTQYQSRGLNKVERLVNSSASKGLNLEHILAMLRRPSWVLGTLGLGLAVVLQVIALGLSPLIVVQPLGVVALVVTAILNSRMSGVRLYRPVLLSISMCVTGIFVFVAVAAFTAHEARVTDTHLAVILVVFAAIVAALIVVFIVLKKHANALLYIIGTGVLYGFVATFAKAIIARIQQQDFDALTWLAIAALVIGAALGMIYVQNAHSSGPPDLVIAGLTVIDPIVAVLIGIIILGEARHAPFWAFIAFVVTGLIAMIGVFGIARYHPQSGKNSLSK